MLLLFYNTGARVAEVIHLKRNDIDIYRQHTVHFIGKGRKERVVPLWPRTVKRIKSWLAKIPQAASTPLCPNRFGEPLTRPGVRQRLIVAQRRATDVCPSLKQKHITPHTLRHTTAIYLLQSGVDLSLIALWLGHEHIDTTHQYMEANLDMTKFNAPSDEGLSFLENL